MEQIAKIVLTFSDGRNISFITPSGWGFNVQGWLWIDSGASSFFYPPQAVKSVEAQLANSKRPFEHFAVLYNEPVSSASNA